MAQGNSGRVSCKTMSSTCHHMSDRFVVSPSIESFLSFECLYIFSHLFTAFILLILRVVETAEYKNPVHTQNEEYGPVAIPTPLTGYEPNQLDNFDFTETYTSIFQNESVDIDTVPSYSFDVELEDELIGRALSTPSHSVFSRTLAHLRACTAWLKVTQGVSHVKQCHPHVTTCLIVRCLSIH